MTPEQQSFLRSWRTEIGNVVRRNKAEIDRIVPLLDEDDLLLEDYYALGKIAEDLSLVSVDVVVKLTDFVEAVYYSGAPTADPTLSAGESKKLEEALEYLSSAVEKFGRAKKSIDRLIVESDTAKGKAGTLRDDARMEEEELAVKALAEGLGAMRIAWDGIAAAMLLPGVTEKPRQLRETGPRVKRPVDREEREARRREQFAENPGSIWPSFMDWKARARAVS